MSFDLDADTFARWLERYREAWERRDPALAGALFTDDATYRETPFDPPFEGRAAIEAYWARVTAAQKDVRFTSDVVACAGDEGLGHWHAVFESVPGGDRVELDGIFRCRFEDEALVSRLEEWWHLRVAPKA